MQRSGAESGERRPVRFTQSCVELPCGAASHAATMIENEPSAVTHSSVRLSATAAPLLSGAERMLLICIAPVLAAPVGEVAGTKVQR